MTTLTDPPVTKKSSQQTRVCCDRVVDQQQPCEEPDGPVSSASRGRRPLWHSHLGESMWYYCTHRPHTLSHSRIILYYTIESTIIAYCTLPSFTKKKVIGDLNPETTQGGMVCSHLMMCMSIVHLYVTILIRRVVHLTIFMSFIFQYTRPCTRLVPRCGPSYSTIR